MKKQGLVPGKRAITNKYMLDRAFEICELMKLGKVTLEEWRNVRESSVGQWINKNPNKIMEGIMNKFQKHCDNDLRFLGFHYLNYVLEQYALAYLQEHYFMTINYEEGQIIMFHEKKDDCDYAYDSFPPMMFCRAASDRSCNYICHKKVIYRRGITIDHPFTSWLLENAVQLKQNFQRQFQQLIEYFCQRDAEDIIQIYNVIREQICFMSNRYGSNAKELPRLNISDFWVD